MCATHVRVTCSYGGVALSRRSVLVTGQRSPGRPIAARGRELSLPNPGPDVEGEAPCPTALGGEARGEISPVPGAVVMADEHRPTNCPDLTELRDVAREPSLGPLTRGLGLNSIAKTILNRLGDRHQTENDFSLPSIDRTADSSLRPMAGLQIFRSSTLDLSLSTTSLFY